jgi:quinol monooxygenase YgiN
MLTRRGFAGCAICAAAGFIATDVSAQGAPPATTPGVKGGPMSKLAIVATINTVPGKREEYLTFLKAHRKRCLAIEPGTLQFEILVPQEEADTVMVYEMYASPEAFETHWNGPSNQQMQQEAAGLRVSVKGVRCNLVE